MTRGGKRPNSGRKALAPADKRKAYPVYLTDREYTAARCALEAHETRQDFMREAIEQFPRTRAAISEIEDMIRGCKLTESTARGKQLEVVETQRRTLEFVLGCWWGETLH